MKSLAKKMVLSRSRSKQHERQCRVFSSCSSSIFFSSMSIACSSLRTRMVGLSYFGLGIPTCVSLLFVSIIHTFEIKIIYLKKF